MSTYDWNKLDAFLPGCTHAAIDPFGMLVVMKVEKGVPFFHQSNRWIPGEEGVRKDYGLTQAYGPDFSPQSTLGANPARQAEIAAARDSASGVDLNARRQLGPGVSSGPSVAPTLNQIQDNPDTYQRPPQHGQPAVVDGIDADHSVDNRGHFGTKGDLANQFHGEPTAQAEPPKAVAVPLGSHYSDAPLETPLQTTDATLRLVDEIGGAVLAYTTIHGPPEKHAEMQAKLDELRSMIKRETP